MRQRRPLSKIRASMCDGSGGGEAYAVAAATPPAQSAAAAAGLAQPQRRSCAIGGRSVDGRDARRSLSPLSRLAGLAQPRGKDADGYPSTN